MWIYTRFGFYSIVAIKGSDDRLAIRSRSKEDLINLIERFELLDAGESFLTSGIIETTNSDYRFRIFVSRAVLKKLMAGIAEDIDYPNFKNEVEAKQGLKRYLIYEMIWSTSRMIGTHDQVEGLNKL